jgi:NAD(P)-dependent dehydrogenase (short-subunit alcohol dehydrogenase family)
MIGFTRSMAVDFAERGITAVAACPGVVGTPSMQRRIEESGDPQAARKAFRSRHLLRRFASPEEIGGLIVYLASPASRFMMETDVVIDGGMSGCWGRLAPDRP